MNAVHVDFIAPPGNLLAIGADEEAGQVVDWTGGAMVAGNPLRIFELQRAGGDGNGLVRVQDVSRRVAEIHMQHDWAGHVRRCLFVRGGFVFGGESGKSQ